MRSNILMFSLAVLLTPGAWAGTVYKCRNAQGDLVYQETPCKQDTQSIKSWAASQESQPADDGARGTASELVIPQRGNGHYFVDGSVNGKALTFVVDTGASGVVLPRQLAMTAGVYCRNQIMMQTVGGASSGCTSIVSRLDFGPFRIRDVPVMIAPNLSQPLLGMNVLRQFRVEQDGGMMRISLRN